MLEECKTVAGESGQTRMLFPSPFATTGLGGWGDKDPSSA